MGQGQSTLLTHISQIGTIHVRFTIPERDYLNYARRREERGKTGETAAPPPFEMVLSDGTVHPYKGQMVFVDRNVDPQTGTILMEAAFPNPAGIVRPGQYARVRAAIEVKQGAILVPQRAVTELQGIYNVAVVGGDDTVELRMVKPGERIGTLWVVDSGLKAGERVVVEGSEGPLGEGEGRDGDDRGGRRNSSRRSRAGGRRAPRASAMASFFIRRPIVAIVIAIITVLLGLNGLRGSASSSTRSSPAHDPRDRHVSGPSAVAVEHHWPPPSSRSQRRRGMIYMKSSNTSDGRMQLDVSGRNQAWRGCHPEPRPPPRPGCPGRSSTGGHRQEAEPSILMIISLYSPKGSYTGTAGNYCGINVRDQLLGPGIAQVDLFGGTDYGMRICPARQAAKLGLTPSESCRPSRANPRPRPAGSRTPPRTRSSPTR